MKYFCSNSTVVKTVRKEGYYPSSRVSDTLTRSVAIILELNEKQSMLFSSLLRNGVPTWGYCKEYYGHWPVETRMGICPYSTFTPAQLGALESLIKWWSIEDDNERVKRCFTLVDLNRGVSLCIVSSRDV